VPVSLADLTTAYDGIGEWTHSYETV
jgi:hypothetical protein